ncbi:MAG: DUF3048 domain-containing protein [Clostridia bacterium]|nr:DUF3048 domain-containing protein [Clostridia bacterium]
MNKKMVKIVSIVMVLTLLLITFAGCNNKQDVYEEDPNFVPQTTEPITEQEEEIPENMNPLTGLLDLSESAQGSRPIAIMVENTSSARPQWGLTSPDLIVEGLVEGGVTRMMWVYADSNKIPDKVGPVRSARHDFVELAAGMNAIYTHWGGSDGKTLGKYMAYQAFEKYDMDNIDGTKYENTYFFRDKTRTNVSLEHRGYVTKSSIQKAIKNLGYSTKQTVEDWVPYKVTVEGGKIPWNDSSEYSGPCSALQVTYSSSYVYTFRYNAKDQLYYNELNGKKMTDGNNDQQMAVKNAIFIYVPVESMNTDKGHVDWKFDAKNIDNKGMYIANGMGQKISWKFDAETGSLKFYDFNNNPLIVHSGKTYIGIIPIDNRDLTQVTE